MSEHPMVLRGENGWLFLNSDGNRVIEQVTGKYILESDFEMKWKSLLEMRSSSSREMGFQYFFGIVPNKECVYTAYLPASVHVVDDRPVQKILAAASSVSVNHRYFLNTLKEAARHRDVFVTGDTHWNHFGAYHAFNEIMRSLSLPVMDETDFVCEVREVEGDLSSKLGHNCSTYFMGVKNRRYKLTDINNVNNIGRREIFENDDKSLPRCVFFRDSFGSHQLEMLATRFSRLVCIWQPNIDYGIIRSEAPDFVISQQVERFLVECPDDLHGPSHKEYEEAKLAIL